MWFWQEAIDHGVVMRLTLRVLVSHMARLYAALRKMKAP